MFVQGADLRLIQIHCHLWWNQLELSLALYCYLFRTLTLILITSLLSTPNREAILPWLLHKIDLIKFFIFHVCFCNVIACSRFKHGKILQWRSKGRKLCTQIARIHCNRQRVVSFEIHFNKLCIYIFNWFVWFKVPIRLVDTNCNEIWWVEFGSC